MNALARAFTPVLLAGSLVMPGLAGGVANADAICQDAAGDDRAIATCERVSSTGLAAPRDYNPPPTRSPGPATLWTAYALEGISSSTFTQPKVVDLDHDGEKEIISALLALSTEVTPGVYVWDCAGQLRDGFPVFPEGLNIPPLNDYLSIVGVADVCRDHNLEIVVATGRNRDDADFCGGVYVISHTGEIIAEIETGHGFSGIDSRHAVLSDLDDDGKAEVIATEHGDMDSDPYSGRRMYVWTAQGDEFVDFPGWPVILHESHPAGCEPAVAEVDHQKLIIANVSPHVVGPQPYVKAFDIHGSVVWSVDTPKPWPPLVADVNNDGSLEVVSKTRETNGLVRCIILDINGNTLHHWPTQEGWSYGKGIALGDLDDHVGTLEVVHHDDARVFVRDYAGKLWFTRLIWDDYPTHSRLTNLGVADLDGDGSPDIYGFALYDFRDGSQGSYQNSVFAFDRFGNTLSGFPFHLINQRPFPPEDIWTYTEKHLPTFADINNDGIADMVTSKGWGRVEAFTLNTPHRQRTAHFPEYSANVCNTKLVRLCPGDLDGDGDTDQADLGMLLADWGCSGGDCPGDCDFDGDTDQSDLGILLGDWGCES